MQKRSGLLKAAVAALVIAVTGCATEKLNLPVDNAVSHGKVDRLKEGASTKAEVKAILGDPLDVLTIDGTETWFYKDFNLRTLHLVFDANGVLSDLRYDD